MENSALRYPLAHRKDIKLAPLKTKHMLLNKPIVFSEALSTFLNTSTSRLFKKNENHKKKENIFICDFLRFTWVYLVVCFRAASHIF